MSPPWVGCPWAHPQGGGGSSSAVFLTRHDRNLKLGLRLGPPDTFRVGEVVEEEGGQEGGGGAGLEGPQRGEMVHPRHRRRHLGRRRKDKAVWWAATFMLRRDFE